MGERSLSCSAPARANLIGNPTDIYGGAVLACSVPLRARVRVQTALALHLVTQGKEVEIRSEADLGLRGDLFDLARVAVRSVGREGLACRIEYTTEVPRQSGMGGSSALLVSLLQALHAWKGEPLALHALAECARQVEFELMEIVCGYVDQYMCSFGGLRYIDFRGKQLDRSEGEEPYASVETLDDAPRTLPFLLAYTGVQHRSGVVHSPIRERWLAGDPEVLAAYERVTEIAGLGKRAFLTGDWSCFGALMNENHAIQRQLGGSGPSNERLISTALNAGALAAKLAGAGHGGTIVALGLPQDLPGIEEALRSAGAVAIYRPEIVPGVMLETDQSPVY